MSNSINPGGFMKDTIQDGVVQGGAGPTLQKEHPELYGRLLMANEKLENIGTLVIWLAMMFVLALCATIHMAWVDPIFGIPVAKLQSWWVYLLIVVATFVVYCIYNEINERALYRKLKPGIVNYLNQHGLSIPWLVSQVENDDSLEEIAGQLKNDTSV